MNPSLFSIHVGDVVEGLRALPDNSVHCVVTSPPYWGLRHYGAEGQIGLETSLDDHLVKMVEVFREVRRVLRPDGTVWANYGDSYAQSGVSLGRAPRENRDLPDCSASWSGREQWGQCRTTGGSLKPKDLMLLPARFAIALQDDGWYLRSEIIWAKGLSFCPSYSGSVMPESVKDRPINAHEKMYLLTKSPKYFYDAEAAREPAAAETSRAYFRASKYENNNAFNNSSELQHTGSGVMKNCTRSIRNVWTIGPQPLKANHFATFPEKLVEPCIKAGTSEKGCCPECGSPWKRVVEKTLVSTRGRVGEHKGEGRADVMDAGSSWNHSGGVYGYYEAQTKGWIPGCTCPPSEPVPCTVLDPFAGSGTTALVAYKLGRRGLGIELNPEYAEIARDRFAAHLAGMSITNYLKMKEAFPLVV